jgi:hypothetical protein
MRSYSPPHVPTHALPHVLGKLCDGSAPPVGRLLDRAARHPHRAAPSCHRAAPLGIPPSCCTPIVLCPFVIPPSCCTPIVLHPVPEERERGAEGGTFGCEIHKFLDRGAGDGNERGAEEGRVRGPIGVENLQPRGVENLSPAT